MSFHLNGGDKHHGCSHCPCSAMVPFYVRSKQGKKSLHECGEECLHCLGEKKLPCPGTAW